jgi:hypothetical protein
MNPVIEMRMAGRRKLRRLLHLLLWPSGTATKQWDWNPTFSL